jgi:hypothetical protein
VITENVGHLLAAIPLRRLAVRNLRPHQRDELAGHSGPTSKAHGEPLSKELLGHSVPSSANFSGAFSCNHETI